MTKKEKTKPARPAGGYPKAFLDHINSISNKRARIVIDHIMKHGFITTEDLETTYGYSHPPRAARDVREAGYLLKHSRSDQRVTDP